MQLSDLAKANIEALASREGSGGAYKKCAQKVSFNQLHLIKDSLFVYSVLPMEPSIKNMILRITVNREK